MAMDAAREALVGIWSGMLSMQVFADRDSASAVDHVGYLGTFSLREARQDGAGFAGVLEHKMEAASDAALLVEDAARPFTVSGDSLMLGDGRTWRRMFERVRNV